MWKRKNLKDKAKKTVKNNYWTAVVLCFVITILTGEYGNSITGIWQSGDSVLPDYVITQNQYLIENEISKDNIAEIQEKQEKIEEITENLTENQLKMVNTITSNLNSLTKSQKYIYKIWDAIELFIMNQNLLGIAYVLIAIIAILYIILLAEPLLVAERRYFIIASEKENTKMGVMKEIFKRKNWSNVAVIMFFKNFYNFLWYLTIIGGIIKTYEYRMIPYLLAENPDMNKKEAFARSKQMMKGNKWKTFILDLSFILWEILSTVTFGLLDILYVNPYKIATSVELYKTLKENNNVEEVSKNQVESQEI
jgi:uncharacterized membrane protein